MVEIRTIDGIARSGGRFVLLGVLAVLLTVPVGALVRSERDVDAAQDAGLVDLVANIKSLDLDDNPITTLTGSTKMKWEATVHNNGADPSINAPTSVTFSQPYYHMEVQCESTGDAVCPDPTGYSITNTNASFTIPTVPGTTTTTSDPAGHSLKFTFTGYATPVNDARSLTATFKANPGPNDNELNPSTNESVQNLTLETTVADVEVTKKTLPASEGGTDYATWGDTLTYEVTVEYKNGNVAELLGVGILDKVLLNRTSGFSVPITSLTIACEKLAGPDGYGCPSYVGIRGEGEQNLGHNTVLFKTQEDYRNTKNDDEIMPLGAKLKYRIQMTTSEPGCSSTGFDATQDNWAGLEDIEWADSDLTNNSQRSGATALGPVAECPPPPEPIAGSGVSKSSDHTQPDGTEFNEWGDALKYNLTFTNPHNFDVKGMEFIDIIGRPNEAASHYILATLLDPEDPNDPYAFKCNYTGTANNGQCPTFTKNTTPTLISRVPTILNASGAATADWVFEAGQTIELEYWVRYTHSGGCYSGPPPTGTPHNIGRANVVAQTDPRVAPLTEQPLTNAERRTIDTLIKVDECPTADMDVTKTYLNGEDERGWDDIHRYKVEWVNNGQVAVNALLEDHFVTNTHRGQTITIVDVRCETEGATQCPEELRETPFNVRNDGWHDRWARWLVDSPAFKYETRFEPGDKLSIYVDVKFGNANVCGSVRERNQGFVELQNTDGVTYYDPDVNDQDSIFSTPWLTLPYVSCYNLSIQKSQTVVSPVKGEPFDYTVTITNLRADPAKDQLVIDDLKPYFQLSGTPTCEVVSGDATCPDDIDVSDEVNGPVITAKVPLIGNSASIKISIPVVTDFVGSVNNTAEVKPENPNDESQREIDPSDNKTSVNIFANGNADIWTEKSTVHPYHLSDGLITYKVLVGNKGSDNVAGLAFIDRAPEGMTIVRWTCEYTGANYCTEKGEGNINELNAALVVGGQVTYTVYAKADEGYEEADQTNSGRIGVPVGVVDPDIDNNNDSATSSPGEPSVSLVKSVSKVNAGVVAPTTLVQPGDTVDYRFVITNTGDFHLKVESGSISDPRVETDDVDVVCPVKVLAPDETATCTLSKPYRLTADDIDAGGIENSATVSTQPTDKEGNPLRLDPDDPESVVDPVTDRSDTGTEPGKDTGPVSHIQDPETKATANPLAKAETSDETDDDPTTWEVTPTPRISLIKSLTKADPAVVGDEAQFDVGDRLTYRFRVTNTGNLTLTNVKINDARIGVVDLACVDSVAPGATTTCETEVVYTLTQGDIDRGGVENTATVTSTAVDGAGNAIDGADPVTDTSDTGTEPAAGTDEIITVDDPESKASSNPLEDVDPTDETDDDPTTWQVEYAPAVILIKSLTDADPTVVGREAMFEAGDQLTYSFKVTNTGNVALADLTIDDLRIGVTDLACVDALAVGATADCESTVIYTLTQSDIDNGGVENSATVTGTAVDSEGEAIVGVDPAVDVSDTGTEPAAEQEEPAPVTDVGPGGVSSDNPLREAEPTEDPGDDPTTWVVEPVAKISLFKYLAKADPTVAGSPEYFGPGDELTYTFQVVNTGNVALSNVTVDDPLLGIAGLLCVAELPVGGRAACEFELIHVLTKQDVKAGGVENIAVASAVGVDSTGDVIPGLDPVSDVSDTGTDPATDGGAISQIDDPEMVETGRVLGLLNLDGGGGGADPTTWVLTNPEPPTSVERVLAFTGSGTFLLVAIGLFTLTAGHAFMLASPARRHSR